VNTTKPPKTKSSLPRRKEYRANFSLSQSQHAAFKAAAAKSFRSIGAEIVFLALETLNREARP
jgi:hypothetical protein